MAIISRFQGSNTRWIVRGGALLAGLYLVLVLALMWWWSYEPEHFDVARLAQQRAAAHQQTPVTGSVVTSMMRVAPDARQAAGGLSNDPACSWTALNWEFSVLTATRDLARQMRNKFALAVTIRRRIDLKEADPLFSSPSDRWLLPSSEGQYRKAIDHSDGYFVRIGKNDPNGAQFQARADNLADYLDLVSTRLGSLSQRLSASVGQLRLEGDAPVDPNAPKNASGQQIVKTPWTKIDDVFYESRGYTWARLEQLQAIQVDFAPTLQRKNAVIGLKQVIRELEESQKPVWSPAILNGSPFGFCQPLAGHGELRVARERCDHRSEIAAGSRMIILLSFPRVRGKVPGGRKGARLAVEFMFARRFHPSYSHVRPLPAAATYPRCAGEGSISNRGLARIPSGRNDCGFV